MSLRKKIKIGMTIDWDFFSDSDAYDFGHRENPFFIETIWQIRVVGNPELVSDFHLVEHRKTFWEDLKKLNLIPPILMTSESHLHAYPLFMAFPPDLVINFDSHHECYIVKDPKIVTCENWALSLLSKKKKMKMLWVQPPWVDNNLSGIPENLHERTSYCKLEELKGFLPETFDTIISHSCRSGSWMPPWLDEEFESFISESGAKRIDIPEDEPVKRIFKAPTPEEILRNKDRQKILFSR